MAGQKPDDIADNEMTQIMDDCVQENQQDMTETELVQLNSMRENSEINWQNKIREGKQVGLKESFNTCIRSLQSRWRRFIKLSV